MYGGKIKYSESTVNCGMEKVFKLLQLLSASPFVVAPVVPGISLLAVEVIRLCIALVCDMYYNTESYQLYQHLKVATALKFSLLEYNTHVIAHFQS